MFEEEYEAPEFFWINLYVKGCGSVYHTEKEALAEISDEIGQYVGTYCYKLYLGSQ